MRDWATSVRFYQFFGYELVLTWSAEDDSLTIAHLMRSDGQIIELFGYAANRAAAALAPPPGNDLDRLGLKHFAFTVTDIEGARAAVLAAELGEVTPILEGRTRITYFFVRDPDGSWVEIVQENRSLDRQRPWQLRGNV